jgi:hypothetical protein
MLGKEWKITIYKMLFYWKTFTIHFFLGLRTLLTAIYSMIFKVAHRVDKQIFRNVEQQFQLLERISGISVGPAVRGAKERKLWKRKPSKSKD